MTTATKKPIKPVHSLVGFIDILGFSQKVRSAKTTDDLQAIANAVRLVQSEFEATPPADSKSDVKAIHRMHAKKVLAFSDCVVVAIGMRSPMTRHEGAYDPLMMQVCGLAYSQAACVLQGIFLRGGIELGWWWLKQSVLVSSALAAAYEIEQNEVDVPVLALGSELYNHLKQHPHRGFYAPSYDSFDNIIIPLDTGGEKALHFINYLQVVLESLDWSRSRAQRERYRRSSPARRDAIANSGYRANVRDWLRAHARAVKTARAQATSKKIRGKYDWLADYHNSACEKFGNPTGARI